MREAERCNVSLGGSVHSRCPLDVHHLTLFDGDLHCSVHHGARASAVTRVEASAAFSSTRAASSAYSNLLTRITLSALPTTMPELATLCSLKILSRPAMKHTGERTDVVSAALGWSKPCQCPADGRLTPPSAFQPRQPTAACRRGIANVDTGQTCQVRTGQHQ